MKKTRTMVIMIFTMAVVLFFSTKTYAAEVVIAYDDTYVIPYSDSVYLISADLNGLTLQGINYAKNEIYARRGYIFKSTELDGFFQTKTWYRGTTTGKAFSDKIFNSYEIANIKYLNDIEFTIVKNGYKLDQKGYDYDDIYSYPVYEEEYEPEVIRINDYYIFPDVSTRYLTESEISGLSLQELCYARNEIYAKHGYIFKSNELNDYFYSQSWYTPVASEEDFDFSTLNAYERANSDLLYRREYSLSATGYSLY